MNITVSTNELYVKGGKSGVEIVTFTSTEPIQVTYEQITNGLNGYTRVSIVDNFTTNVTWKIEYSGLNVHNEIYKGEIHARLTGSDEELVVPVTIDCSVPSTNRIETTCKTLYVKGEKNGTETVVFTCAEPIEVTYEQFTNNLNGNVRVWIENNFTNEVTWNVEYSDLYLCGETYSGLIHARLSGDVDSLDVPVVINCSDTLIYSDVPNDTVIEVEEGIHITYSSLPEVNKVWIVFEDGTETDITDLLNGQTIDLTYEYLLNRFGVADYDYICATNGLSQITHKLNKVVYKLEIIGAAFKRIDWKMQRVSFILRSTRNNKSCGFDVSASDGSKVDVFYINGDTGIYKISCLVDENGLDIEREIILNVVQRESKYEVRFKILQGVYVYVPEIIPIDYIFRISYNLLSSGNTYDVFSYGTGVNISDIQIYDNTFNPVDYSITPDRENLIQRVMITPKNNKSARESYLYVNFNYDNVNWDVENGKKYKIGFVAEEPGYGHSPSITNPASYVLYNNYTPKGVGGVNVFRNMTNLQSVGGSQYFRTSDLTNLSGMFAGCTSFTNLKGLEKWDVSNVTDMSYMFGSCVNLTDISPLANWDVSNVTSMDYMFSRWVHIPSGLWMNLQNISPLANWDVSNVTDMQLIFSNCINLTDISPLANWDVSNVTSMYGMFYICTSLTTIPLLDTSKVTSMMYIFRGCSSLTNIGGFKNLKVDLDLSDSPLLTHESLMNVINNLASVTNETLSLGETNLTKLTDDEIMIAINKGWNITGIHIPLVSEENEFIYVDKNSSTNGPYYTISLYNWREMSDDTSIINAFIDDIPYGGDEFDGIVGVEYNYKFKVKGTDYAYLFGGCPIYKVVKFDTSNAISMHHMFYDCDSLTTTPLLDTSKVTDMGSMFYSCSSLTTIPQLDTSKVTDMNAMFKYCSSLTTIPLLDTSKVTDMNNMFFSCSLLASIPLLDTSKVTDMGSMFGFCGRLKSIPLLDTSNVTDMNHMFYDCDSLTTIPLLDTSNVTDMGGMFGDCYILTSIPQLDTSNVTDMTAMFYRCLLLNSIPLLDTSNVTDMEGMFFGCNNLSDISPLANWDTSNVTDMNRMFYGCRSLTTIPPIDTSNVTYMGLMFYNCDYLTTIPLLDTSNVTSMYDIFSNCSSLTNIGGFKNLKTDLDLSDSPLLTHESLMNVINNLASVTNETLSLGKTNLAKLTNEEKRIAIDKGWYLS